MEPVGLALLVGSGVLLLGSKPRKVASSGPLPSVRGIERTSPAFRSKVAKIAASLNASTVDLLLCISFETAGTFDPAEMNPVSHAIGLIQFMPSTAASLGTSTEELAMMTPIRQLDFVEMYLRRIGKNFPRLEDLYMAILSPNAVGRSVDHVLFRDPQVAYRQNRGLDTNSDGEITIGEATSRVRQMQTRARMNLLLVGDSLAEGIGQQLAPIARASSVQFLTESSRGSTMTKWSSDNRLRNLAERIRPSHILISLGTNDAAAKINPEWQRYTIERLIDAARSVRATPLWVGLPSLPFAADKMREVIVDECNHKGARVFDSRAHMFERASDQIHFTPKGYRDFASALARWIPLPEVR